MTINSGNDIMKKILLALSLLAVLFNFGCGKKSEDAGGTAGSNSSNGGAKLVIAVIPKGTTHIYWQSLKAGAEAAAKEYNCDIRWNGPEREGDREREIQIVEDFIVQKVDGVVLAPLDRQALAPSVDKLAALKIPCVIVDSDVATSNRVCFAATDNYKGGVLAGERMGKILNGKGNVMILMYEPGSASTTERENGFIDTIQKEFPDIKIVDKKYGQDTVETALQAAEDLLTRNQDVQGFFACNESTAVGTLQAVLSQKRTEIKLVGFDGSKALLDGLRAGQIDSLVVQNPYKMGYEGVKAVVMAIKGQPVEKRIDTGVALITRDNLDDPATKELLRIP
ncbi:MAG TPA: substrate-binding domain-containing protein [Verrucomicrobiae bacterium]|jgi:ribose transport system substrate-binding protein|nr:substrate-binding domain-containing protein [Verrucomicrobiae bacterium]